MPDFDSGGFAFPGPVCGDGSEHQITDMQWQAHGMTLRDYFAGQALALIGGARGVPVFDAGAHPAIRAEWVAAQAYLLADAMLKARKEPQ